MIIIDANTKISDKFTAEMLIQHMNRAIHVNEGQARVEKSLTLGRASFMDRDPPTSPQDYDRHVEWLTAQTGKHTDRLVPMMTLNPLFEQAHALDVLERTVKQNGVRVLKLHPNLHGFRPNDDVKLLGPIFERCHKLGIPLFMHSGDPFSEPTRIETVAQTYRDVPLVILHFGTQTISFALDAIAVTKRNENVYLETSWAIFPRLREAVRTIGCEKLIFGSDAPVNDITAQAMVVAGLMQPPPVGIGLKEEDAGKIFSGNIAKLANIPLGNGHSD